jgi:hypothetical protein
MQVGKVFPYDLQKNYSQFYSEMNGTAGSGYIAYCPKILHNQEQIVRCQLRDGSTSPAGNIKYWNMDGSPAAQFTVGSGGTSYKNILDITWINDESKYAYIMMDPTTVTGNTYNVYKCTTDGLSPEVVISGLDPGSQYASWVTASTSGYIGIAASDTSLFIKIGNSLYRVPEGVNGSWSSISSQVSVVTDAFHHGDGSNCRNLMYQPVSGTTTSGYLLYTWYDSSIDVMYLRSIDSQTMAYAPNRWTMLGITDYGTAKEPVFLNQLDYNSLLYFQPNAYTSTAATMSTVTGTYAKVSNTVAYLEVFNIDTSLAAFLNVNSSDTVMPAGIGAQATITAQVINCWGTTLSGKLVQFWVSSGDGGVYPSYAYTDANGRAEVEFSTGANVGTSNVSVVVNEV